MSTITAEERNAIRESFARLLAEKASEADLRRTMATEAGYDPELWASIAGMGLPALLVPAEHGGIGAGAVEVEALMEEAGAALFAGPLLSSAVIATGLLARADGDIQARLLPGLAGGERLATVAMTGEGGSWTVDGVSVRAEKKGDRWALTGVASFVPFARSADVILVLALSDSGLGCYEIAHETPGVSIEPLTTWDPTLRLSHIAFDGAEARRIDGIDADAVEAVLDLARVALAGEQAGAARRIFEITVEYLKTRVQFGRPIGGFQALKHWAADLLIEVESATSAARAAAQALADNAPDKQVLVNLAAFACADAFGAVAAAAVQMHGGIAFTWEHPAHLYLRRARADAQLFGNSDTYRERYLTALEQAA